MKCCENCGKEQKQKANYCSDCGKSLTDTKETQSTNRTNGLAIAGFIVSFFAGVVGLILSIVGLVQIRKTNEGGKGLAIAGITISAVKILFSIIACFFFFLVAIDLVDDYIEWDYDYPYLVEHTDPCAEAICPCDTTTERCECEFENAYGVKKNIVCGTPIIQEEAVKN